MMCCLSAISSQTIFCSYEGVTSYGSEKLQDILQQCNYCVINDSNQPTRVISDTTTIIDLVITGERRLSRELLKQLS